MQKYRSKLSVCQAFYQIMGIGEGLARVVWRFPCSGRYPVHSCVSMGSEEQ